MSDEDIAALSKSRLFMDLVCLVDRLERARFAGELEFDPEPEDDIEVLHQRIGRAIERAE